MRVGEKKVVRRFLFCLIERVKGRHTFWVVCVLVFTYETCLPGPFVAGRAIERAPFLCAHQIFYMFLVPTRQKSIFQFQSFPSREL